MIEYIFLVTAELVYISRIILAIMSMKSDIEPAGEQTNFKTPFPFVVPKVKNNVLVRARATIQVAPLLIILGKDSNSFQRPPEFKFRISSMRCFF